VIIPHSQIREEVLALYDSGGLPKGASTGWACVDQHYTVGLGQWTCVTGNPNSGKSEWLDALLVNLVKQEKWKFLIYSPENWPLALHHAKIIEKYIGKPFNPGPNERVTREEVEAAEEWIAGKFYFCKMDRPDMQSVLLEAENHTRSYGMGGWKSGIVVDPWNTLEHHVPQGMTLTQYVSRTLTLVSDTVREQNSHLWLVAHPAKMPRQKDGTFPVPTPRDISDSAHFWNKADACITVHRDQVEGSQDVEIHIQKVRFKHIGRIGLTTLKYDRITGRYFEPYVTPMPMSEYMRKTREAAPL
jgi:twinkle protein